MSLPLAYIRASLVWRQTPTPPANRAEARVALDRLRTYLEGLPDRVEAGRDVDYRTLANDGFEDLYAVERTVAREGPESGRAAYDAYISATRSWLNQLSRLGAFEDLAPSRGWSAVVGVMCIAFDVAVLLRPIDLGNAAWAAVATTLAFFAWSAVFFPDRWVYAIAIEEEGFHFRAPMRRPRFIPWSSITKVVASAYLDGAGESAITLRVRSGEGGAWIPQHLMPYYAVVDRLKDLEGFDHAAWSSAHLPENDLIGGFIGKRTVVYRGRPVAVRPDRSIDTTA